MRKQFVSQKAVRISHNGLATSKQPHHPETRSTYLEPKEKFDHEKEYEVTVELPLSQKAIRTMEKGMPLLGSKTRPAEITTLSPRRFRIVLKEGKNRQIRRMVKKVGNRVVSLKRTRVASLKLGPLKLGEWRYLNDQETAQLLKILEK